MFGLIADFGTQLAVAVGVPAGVEAAVSFSTACCAWTCAADAGRTYAAFIAGAAAAWGSCAEPKIHVQTPFSQPQKPPDDEDDCDALGEGVGVGGGGGGAGLPVPPVAALFDAEAEADAAAAGGADAPAARPVGALVGDAVAPLGLGLALACGVAVAERDAVVEGDALALAVVGIAVPQTAVGNGSGFAPSAALAGVARVSAPATATRATGAPIEATARHDELSGR